MKSGKIEWYSEKRGFGIISSFASDGALDKFFIHVTKIVKSPQKIQQGQQVEFDIDPNPPHRAGYLPAAINVTVIADPQNGGAA